MTESYLEKISSFSDRVIPNLKTIDKFKQPLTKGELELVLFFDKHLPKDSKQPDLNNLENYNGWLIFVQPSLNGLYPNIVIFHKNNGAYIYSVEEENLQNNCTNNTAKNTQTNVKKPKKLTPLQLVQYYEYSIKYILVRKIGNSIANNKNQDYTVKGFVYFPNTTSETANNFYNMNMKKQKQYYNLFGKDLLLKNNLKLIPPFNSNFYTKTTWQQEWNENILFWLYPPKHLLEQGEKITFYYEQKQVATPKTGHYRVKGKAGTGKSMALVYRAASLASQNKKVLVLTYNITLVNYLKTLTKKMPLTFSFENIHYYHFHNFCKKIIYHYRENWPQDNCNGIGKISYEKCIDNFFAEKLPQYVMQLTHTHPDLKPEYDAILIDEGNDFYPKWYEMITNFLSSRNELIICFDTNQNIYNIDLKWIDIRYKEGKANKILLHEFLKNKILYINKVMRSNNTLTFISDLFSHTYLNNTEKPTYPGDFQFDSEIIKWINIGNPTYKNFILHIGKSLIKLKNINKNFKDIAIIVPTIKSGWAITGYLTNSNIKTTVALEIPEENDNKYSDKEKIILSNIILKFFKFNAKHCNCTIQPLSIPTNKKILKRTFLIESEHLKVSTIHSFKGWEIENVILVLPPDRFSNASKMDFLTYVGLTRTTRNLFVINFSEKYKEFSQLLKKYNAIKVEDIE